jgi:mannose-1-phosphate guanylyltransferase
LVDGPFLAAQGAVIDTSATITGGSAIGAGTKVGPGVKIDDCIIGDNCVIEDGARLEHSFIAHGTTVKSGSVHSKEYLSQSAISPINL